ncbi:hypothetical protein TYRP_017855 [Tyrophagus putrescentiae]|nr:hypothetical protein TYRP_017855 [Tyrophagus putrescentiae]
MSGGGLILATKRLKRDLQQFNLDPAAQTMYHIEPISDEDIFELKGRIYGPPDSPYHGGVFHLTVSISENYPFKSPKMVFTTKIWHPNINESGGICLDTLQKKWSAAFSLRTAMMSVQALLSSPSAASGINPEALKQMREFPEEYKKTASFWTYHYAMDTKTDEVISANGPQEDLVKKVMAQTGRNYDKALYFLSSNNWDIKKLQAGTSKPATKVVKRK